MIRTIVLHENDNVAVVTEPAEPGDLAAVSGECLAVRERIPTGHKMAVRPIPAGSGVVKYGVVIGRAGRDITPGEWVHTHNVVDITEQLCNEYAAQYRAGVEEARSHGQHSGV